MILETVLTTLDAAGTVNAAPMGAGWGDEVIELRPYRRTRTFRNLLATPAAVVNLTDDALAFTWALIGPPPPTRPAERVPGAVLEAACSWREVRVLDIDESRPRARVRARVVHGGQAREFLGFNRAAHAVLEASIVASRARRLPRRHVLSELARLQVIVDKTAGTRELLAMELLTRHVHAVLGGTPQGVP